MAKIKTETVIDDRYRILGKLGSGGMSDVYLCDDINLGRKVALKILHSRFAQDKEFVERFQREARSAASLQHRGVVSIYDRGQLEDTYYIAMEYLEGRSLKELITEEAPLQVERALKLAKQILAALQYAHQKGIIHRDVKPQNVIVDDTENVKVMDFGIARAAGSEITEVGSILGTAQYLSPEQAQGKPVSDASDIYSLGVVLYEMLTGCVPFDGASAVSVALKHVNEDPTPIAQLVADVPEQVEVVVMRALAKDPSRRYQSAQTFASALNELTDEREEDGQRTASWAPIALPPEDAEATSLKTDEKQPKKAKDTLDNGRHVMIEDGHVSEPNDGQRWLTKKKAAWIGISVAIVAAALVAWFFIANPGQVEVPSLIGAQVEDARSTLEASELVVDVKRVNSNASFSQVIEQDPIAGEKVAKNTTVKLTVSKGPGTTRVPKLAGVTEKTATKRLRKEKLKVDIEKENSAKVDLGKVIRSDPRSGAVVTIGGRVLIVVSSGPAIVDVPTVTGISQQEAIALLEDAKLSVVVEKEDSMEDEGKVIKQSPSAGSSVDENTIVTVVVSNGKGAEVPSVVGLSEGAATGRLEKAGFEVNVKEKKVDRVDKDGIVSSQSPSKGAEKRKGDTVTITVGLFELPEPEGTVG